jgi:3',5'-cyclic AMP phosphodiesterase CpdA
MQRKIWLTVWGLFFLFRLGYGLANVPLVDEFSFLVFGDNQNGDKIFDHLLKQMATEPKIAFAISVGDSVDYSTETEYLAYCQKVKRLEFKVLQAPGNHDLANKGAKYFQKYIGSLYNSFDYKNCHFVVLNNAFKDSFDKKQFTWLEQDLAANKQKIIFIFMHRPTFDPTELYGDYVMSGRQVTTEMQKLFARYHVAYVFSGHIHGYARAKRDGVVYIITGGAGGTLHLPPGFGGWYHYVRITVKGEKVTDEMVPLKGY